MRSEADLHAAFEHLADTATPHPEDVLPAVTTRSTRSSRPRWGRRFTVSWVAVATATAIIGGPIAVDHLTHHTSDPAGTARNEAWSSWLTIPVPKTMMLRPRIHTANRQVHQLYSRSSRSPTTACTITAHRNGDFDPVTIPASSKRIWIGRTEGRVVAATSEPQFPPTDDVFKHPLRTVVWQPAAGLWARAACQKLVGSEQRGRYLDDVDRAVAVAGTITATPVRVGSPYQLRFVPVGIKVEQLTSLPAESLEALHVGQLFRVDLGDGDRSTGHQADVTRSTSPKMPFTHDDWRRALFMYGVQPGTDLVVIGTTNRSVVAPPDRRPELALNGLSAWYEPMSSYGVDAGRRTGEAARVGIRIEGPDFSVFVCGIGPAVSADAARKVAEGLRLASTPADPATWFDAATAIP